MSALPARVYERLPNGDKEEAPGHAVQRLVDAPNPLSSWSDVIRWLIGSTLTFGNGLMAIERDGNGQAVALHPVPWTCAQPQLLPSANGALGPLTMSGRLVFDVVQTWGPNGGAGISRRLFADSGEAFLLRDRANDGGLLGVSRLSRAPMVISGAISVQQFSTALWDNVGTPNVVLSHPGRLSPEAMNVIARSWRDQMAGPQNARKLMVLEEAMKAEALNATAEDSQVLESRKWSAEDCARLFGVPPAVLGLGDPNFASSQQAAKFFAQNTLAPWCVAISQEFSRSVFLNDRFFLELDLSALLQGDFQTRAQTLLALQRGGAISANELRHELGWGRVEGGDALVATASGGRPMGQEDQPDSPAALNGGAPPPGIRPNGSATTLQ